MSVRPVPYTVNKYGQRKQAMPTVDAAWNKWMASKPGSPEAIKALKAYRACRKRGELPDMSDELDIDD